jgi:hypothetical protein
LYSVCFVDQLHRLNIWAINQPTPLQADGVWKRICSQTCGLGCSFITSLQAAGNPPLID